MSTEETVVYNGRYEVQRRIARGGMADVFLARDLLLARPVAVKVLFPQFAGDPSFVARFRREAQAAANLNHPNIVGVYDWGQEDGTYYIVMEYVDGKSLSQILRSEGLPPLDAAAGIAADVSAALGFAHRNGVVHRDVKPGNIMITSSGNVKVADFGIARAMHTGADEPLTQTGSVMGTATYFSPEQAQGHDVDPRSDLYSLGCVMYEMATGRPPFGGDSPVAIAYKHVQEQPTPPSAINPAVPPEYDAITMKLLAKNPDDRYASADLLRTDLRRFMQGEKVSAAPPPRPDPQAAPMPTVAERRAPAPVAAQPVATRRTGWFVFVLLILLVALGGLLYAFANTLGLTTKTENVKVPFVVNKQVFVATQQLEAAGLKVSVTQDNNATVPKGDVVTQSVDPGAEVPKRSTVAIVVSEGPPPAAPINLPDVTNQVATTAVSALQAAGFTDIAQAPSYSDTVAVGSVVSMTPTGGPGAQYPAAQPITLFVSSGPNPADSTTTLPPVTTTVPVSTTLPVASTTSPVTTPTSAVTAPVTPVTA